MLFCEHTCANSLSVCACVTLYCATKQGGDLSRFSNLPLPSPSTKCSTEDAALDSNDNSFCKHRWGWRRGGGVHAYVPHLRAAHACSCIYNVMLSCWTTRILFVSDWFKIWRICSCISFNLHFEAQRSFGPQAESAIARCNTLRFTMRKHGVRFSAL